MRVTRFIFFNLKSKNMKTYHIVFKTDDQDFYSTGKDYEVLQQDNEIKEIQEAIQQWDKEYNKTLYPHRKLLVIYLR